MRPLVLAAMLLFAGLALWLARTGESHPSMERLTWIAEAHQLGPVGYRDPAGAISPDGRWIAYSEGRFLRVRAAGGGPLVESAAGEAQIRNIAWGADSRSILADGFQTQPGWALYDRVDGARRHRSGAIAIRSRDDREGVRPAAAGVVADGRSIAAIVNGRDGQDLWTIAADGSSADAQRMAHRIAFPAWTPRGDIACVTTTTAVARLTIPCGGDRVVKTDPDLDVYGPIAFSPGRRDDVSVVRQRLRARSICGRHPWRVAARAG